MLLATAVYLFVEPVRSRLNFYGNVLAVKFHGGNYVNVENASIYYATFGSGTPVLVLHGGLGSLEDMSYQIKALAKSHFVIAADSRGQGRSTDSDQPLSYSLMADDMTKLLDQLKIPRADVVGWSDGGIIGLDLAMRYPARVKKLVAISANFDVSGIRESSTKETGVPRTPLRYRLLAPDSSYWPVIYRKVVTLWRTQPHYSLTELGQIKAPTLVMAGEFDIVKPQHSAQLARAIPQSKEIIVQGATHAVPTDKPDAVNNEILNFLDRN
jgi:pimeloyl-ACP methyl ester carboxylesterase